jgi:putative sterol carrier protein
LINQKAKAQSLFMAGKLKLKGNMGLAMKFETVLKGLEKAGAAKL